MSAIPVGGDQPVRPVLKVVKGRRSLPRLAMVPWLAYTILLGAAFLGLVYSQTSLNERAMDLDAVRDAVAVASSEQDALRLEIARLQAPDRIVSQAVELGMRRPDVALRTLAADVTPSTVAPLAEDPGRRYVEAAP